MYAQKYADKAYYLVDSLNLGELSNTDKEIIESSLKVYHQSKSDSAKIYALNNICDNLLHIDWKKYQFLQRDLIEIELEKELPKKSKKKILEYYAAAINNIGIIYRDKGNILEALKYYEKSFDIQKQLNNEEGIALSLSNIGVIYHQQGNTSKAIEYYSKSLKIREKIYGQSKKDVTNRGIATTLNNIGSLYLEQQEFDLALQYFNKSLNLNKKTNNLESLASSYNSIGVTYHRQQENTKALEYYNKSLTICEQLKDIEGISRALSNSAVIYNLEGNSNKALELFEKSLSLSKKIKDKVGEIRALNNIGSIYLEKNELEKAKKYNIESLTKANEVGYPTLIKNTANILHQVYEKQGNGLQALKMYKLYVSMKDSVLNKENQKTLIRKQAEFEYDKQKAIDDAEYNKLLALEQEKKEKQIILTTTAVTVLGLVILFLFFIFNRLRITKKQKIIIENQKLEVEAQKEALELTHSELEEKNQEILDSITYAKRIQSAILPPAKIVKEYLQESFILYKPKDIVAGDFYWLEQKENKILFAAADCTGHGVPGAMVSVVCNNALNRSVREHGLTIPGEILSKTREIVIHEFEKSDEEVNDGMDIALCSLEGNKLQYAGAHNPLWIIRNEELIEIKADKQPIGKYDKLKPYTTHSFELQTGDSIYIFSDGYVDQFGGVKGKKFKTRAFRELLLSIQEEKMMAQKNIIDKTFESWRGNLEQIDDVCIIGVKYI
ncbi:MAG: tetratricopeptide repeat protein [Vicingaceae bacterium]|nr:tetratricopeptide repeat protein [Vicingaceae bacterium]